MSPEQTELLFNSVIVFVAALLVWLAKRLGSHDKAQAQPRTETVELAGAVINSKDVNRLIDSHERLTAATVALAAILPAHQRVIEQSTESIDEMRDSVKDVARDIRDATYQMLNKK